MADLDEKSGQPGAEGPSEGQSRREHERQPIELKVEYRRLNSFFADYTRNISKGGTFIQTDKPLDIGTEFVFKLYIPALAEPLRIHGQVKWTVQPGEARSGRGKHGPGMGIRFIYSSQAERDEIEDMVGRLMVDSLGQVIYTKLIAHSETEPGDTDE